MRTRKGSQTSSNKGPHPVAGEADQKAESHVKGGPSTTASANNAPTRDETGKQQAEGVRTSWRLWWQRFRADFYAAHPEKQVAQIYYITAILAVMGSLAAGLWALGIDLWSEKSALTPQNPAGTRGTTATTKPTSTPELSIVVLPFVNLSGDA